MRWVPLHTFSQYSVLDSAISVESLAERAKAMGMGAIALTDQGNLYGAVEFFKACKENGVKPLIGCELAVAPGSRMDKKRQPGFPSGFPLVLIAKNQKGYQNLCKLSSSAHLEGFYYTPRIDKELLAACAEGLICLSGSSLAYWIGQGNEQELLKEIKWYQAHFGADYYFELQRHKMRQQIEGESWLYQQYLDYIAGQEKVNERLVALAQELAIELVATNKCHYLEKEDWRAHEILMNIQSGEPCQIWERDSQGNPKVRVPNPKRKVLPTRELYFKSPEEMEQLFADLPQAIENTVRIAEKCTFSFDFKARHYPVFVPPSLEGKSYTKEERLAQAALYLKQLCEKGIAHRYQPHRLAKVSEKYPGRDPMDVVRERLKYELEIITSKGMCDYLLIVWDFISWAKRAGIPMGPGRGSGAGSIILYLIEITDIEPLRFNLFFERFINPERISYPDIDVDICMDRRAEVIDYTVQKYGKDRVAQIITFGTMKAKMAIKDVGRVLSVPLPKVNGIAKLVPEDPNMTLEKALELDPELRRLDQEDPEVHELLDLARKLEGSVRNTGIHAAGMIISEGPIVEHLPVCTAKDSDMAVTQFSMKPVEAVGMLKIDFLGLKTLTSIQHTVDAIEEKSGKKIDWIDLPLEDKATFDLLNQGKTMGIFQLESGGMQDLAKQLHIDKFEEIIAVGALYRPGPMEMIPSFIQRKHGKEPIDIDHPLMHDILSETYGIMVYQEQVMQIASRLAGYTLGEGDVLRRAMGKKDREEMARQREKFRTGALKNGIDPETSMKIFDKVEKFASYGFNKSHAAAYGYLTYVTAYLKANYPAEWMAALMTSDRDDVSKLARLIRESQSGEIQILPPDVNESGREFVATERGIRFAMSGIKRVGEGVVDAIVEERKKRGPFPSLYGFMERVDTKKVTKKSIEHLIEAGAFDFTKWSRPAMLMSVDPMFQAASEQQRETEKGIRNLFEEKNRFDTPPTVTQTVSRQKLLQRENELLGFYLNGHPLDEFRELMKKLSCVPLGDIVDFDSGSVIRAAFIIEGLTIKLSSKTQRKFAILMIGDGSGRFELPIWPDLYDEKGHLLVENQLLYAVLQLERQEGELKLQCRWLGDLTQVSEMMMQQCDAAFDRAKVQSKSDLFRKPAPSKPKEKPSMNKLILKLDADKVRLSHILEIKKMFRSHSGSTPIQIDFLRSGGKLATLSIESRWGIDWSSSLGEKLSLIPSLLLTESS